MDDSDDYFGDDDFVLDEATLAVIVEAESKFQESQRQSQARPSAPAASTPHPNQLPQPPPPKKQKTGHDWGGSPIPLQRQKTSEFDALPEVAVGGYGYGVPPPRVGIAAPIQQSSVPVSRTAPQTNAATVSRPVSKTFANQNRPPQPAPVHRPPLAPVNTATPKAQPPRVRSQQVQAPVAGPSRVPLQRQPSVPHLTQRLNGTSLSQSQSQQTSLGKVNRDLRVELQCLKDEMDKVCYFTFSFSHNSLFTYF